LDAARECFRQVFDQPHRILVEFHRELCPEPNTKHIHTVIATRELACVP